MNRANSNLARARLRVPEAYLEDLCFDAQQAAEKALKAVMMSRGIDFPYTHDIACLLGVLQVDGINLPESMLSAARLTTYSVQARYPGSEARGVAGVRERIGANHSSFSRRSRTTRMLGLPNSSIRR